MNEKYTDATPNRPDGDRPIDASSLFIDLPVFIARLRTEDAWQKTDRNSITVFKTDAMRIVLGALHAGARFPAHKADGVMSLQVLEGTLSITTSGRTDTYTAGQMLAIHKGCEYSITAQAETIYLLTITDVHH